MPLNAPEPAQSVLRAFRLAQATARDALKPGRRLYYAGMILLTVVLMGTTGYYVIGGRQWSWEECLYMTVITLSTVGFAEVLGGMQDLPIAREWTLGLIVLGSGSLLYFGSTLTAFVVEGDLRGVLRRNRMQQQIDQLTDHYIVCGSGDTGMHVISEMLAKRRPFVAIDLNPDRVAKVLEELKSPFLYIIGDATDDDTLITAGIMRARGVVCCLHDDPENLYVTITARALREDLRVVAKALDMSARSKMLRAGANSVVLTHMIGGVRLVREVSSPEVTEFLDFLLRGEERSHHIVEHILGPKSPSVGKAVRDAPLRKEADALILAIHHADGHFEYNPPPELVLEAGMKLILLANIRKLKGLR
jgi:voltage-gated potassium channel